VATATLGDGSADLVTVGDFDRDGRLEYVVGSCSDRDLSVCIKQKAELLRKANISLPTLPIALSSGDLNGDGRPELAVALVDAHVALYASDSDLSFSSEAIIRLPLMPTDLEIDANSRRLIVATASTIHIVAVRPKRNTQCDQPVVNEAAEAALTFANSPEVGQPKHSRVTSGESEVVLLVLSGMTAREIGASLFISERTVETHLAHAYSKLGVSSRFELARRMADGRIKMPIHEPILLTLAPSRDLADVIP
jgi:DNA-binding CsgD family transcriptional regulator